jgi:nicotinamide-nucleotide adenylyltransferase
MKALYIGRFQLFHKGHLDVVKHIDDAIDVTETIIAVGSSQYDYKHKSPSVGWASNPFTYEERKEMIEHSLEGMLRKPYIIQPLPDFHNYPKWFDHLMSSLPKFDCLYTSDEKEKQFFEAKGIEVRSFPKIYNFRATILREKMYTGGDYKSGLPEGTLFVCRKINAVERVKELYAKDLAESLRIKKDSL